MGRSQYLSFRQDRKKESIELIMGLPEYQKSLFNLLSVVDDLCSKHSIRYYLAYGTAIGALREHNIIPWDDDIDIKIPREDFSNFRQVLKSELPAPYVFVDYDDHSGYFHDFIPRIVDTSIDRIPLSDYEKTCGGFLNKLAIDVFLVDNAPKTAVGRSLMQLDYKILYGMALSKRYAFTYAEYSPFQKISVFFLRAVGRLYRIDTIFRLYDRAMTRYLDRTTGWKYISNALLILKYQQFFPAEDFVSSERVLFGDRSFPVNNGIHDELTMIYGDYMKPPAEKDIYLKHTEL